MDRKFEIISYNEISSQLKNSLQTVDSFHSNYFWHNCAKEWQDKFIHKTYVLVDDHRKKIFGFFSLRVNEIIGNKEHIPILDVSFIDTSEELSSDSAKVIFYLFLEYIEELARELSKKVGCRYISSYITTNPDVKNANFPGIPIMDYLEGIYVDMHYFEPPFKNKEKTRKIKNKNSKDNNPILVLKYVLRDLRTAI